MRTRVLAFVGVLAVIGAAAVFLRPHHSSSVAAAPPPPPSTTVATTVPESTTTTAPPPPDAPPGYEVPFHGYIAGDAAVSEVNLYDSPGATQPFDSMSNPTSEHVPLAFLVMENGPPGWLHVQYSRRPNESTAWIHASDVTTRPVDNRIVVEREARTLTVYKGSSDQVLFTAPVADGTSHTPTPLGNFYIDIVVKTNSPGGAYGPYELSVAGFSDVLHSFGGGVGQIAIHGTNHPELIGSPVSNGCIRMHNEDVTQLSTLAPVGTPVLVVA